MNISTKTTMPLGRNDRPARFNKKYPSPRRSPRAHALLLALFLIGALPQHTGAKTKNAPTAPTKSQVAEKKGDLKELREQIDVLQKETSEAEGKRASVADQLKAVEKDISTTQRDLLALMTKRNALQESLKDLGNQSRELENRLNNQNGQLEKLIYRQYVQGTPDSLRLLLNGEDPSQMARDMHYLAAVGKARSQLLQEIEKTLERKKALAADTRERADELVAIEAKQKEQHGKLLAQREQRKVMLDKISAKISEQRREIGNLQRDEKQLSQLIERLAKAIAARPVPPPPAPPATKEGRTTPEKRQEARPEAKETPTEIRNENTPVAAPSGSNFEAMKGGLHLPTRGVLANRFGSSRQEGGLWKGLFIKASPGSEVKAIAGGRVVFADWMRGFGNLLIVDHGGNYLSIYGNNEALLKQVGDSVRGGDTVAAVGNSGGNPESGLYFELRHQGQPLDPLKWVNLR